MYEALISNLCELEKIKAENARLRQERDAAVRDLHHNNACKICVGANKEPEGCDFECLTCTLDCRCKNCRDESLWQWRGPDGRGEAGTKRNRRRQQPSPHSQRPSKKTGRFSGYRRTLDAISRSGQAAIMAGSLSGMGAADA